MAECSLATAGSKQPFSGAPRVGCEAPNALPVEATDDAQFDGVAGGAAGRSKVNVRVGLSGSEVALDGGLVVRPAAVGEPIVHPSDTVEVRVKRVVAHLQHDGDASDPADVGAVSGDALLPSKPTNSPARINEKVSLTTTLITKLLTNPLAQSQSTEDAGDHSPTSGPLHHTGRLSTAWKRSGVRVPQSSSPTGPWRAYSNRCG
jgi:hypothetical protein